MKIVDTRSPFKSAFVFLLTTVLISSCGSKNEIDCEKEPKKAVNNSFTVDGRHVILATTKGDDIYNFNTKMIEDITRKTDAAKGKSGEIGAVADIATHMGEYQDIAKKNLLQGLKSGVITNINTNLQNKMTGDPLQLVVVDCAHVGSKYPVLKVRCINKKCAGSEVWISAHSLNQYGHLINYSH